MDTNLSSEHCRKLAEVTIKSVGLLHSFELTKRNQPIETLLTKSKFQNEISHSEHYIRISYLVIHNFPNGEVRLYASTVLFFYSNVDLL